MELAWVWAAAFPPESQCGATDAGDRGQVAQRVGSMGGDVQQDKVGHAHDVVASSEGPQIVLCGALPFHGDE